MTTWQWRVIMALVRIVLSILDNEDNHIYEDEDYSTLLEAINRSDN
jgi:hypothetical protein